jgi:archaellum component FlaC
MNQPLDQDRELITLFENRSNSSNNDSSIIEIKKEIQDIKKEIQDIKNIMKEMAILMKSVYLFEYQSQMKD